MIDIHSHILPGIDDGSQSLDDSIKIVRELAASGVTDVIATPHYVEETIYTSPRTRNFELLGELQAALDAAGISVRVHLGNEIYINSHIPDLLKSEEISALANTQYLLVELPMSGEYPNYEDIFLALIQSDYQVILAHPERYTSFQRDYSLIEDLRAIGVLLQCNLGSFIGLYGKHAKKTAERLAKENQIFALGTDSHHPRGTGFLPRGLSRLHKFYTEDALAQILINNPRIILNEP